MKLIVSIQIILFLFISPFIAAAFAGEVEYLFGISYIYTISFAIGLVCYKISEINAGELKKKFAPFFPDWVKIIIIGWSFCYVAVVITSGLFFRRQGSEVMAEIYSNLPLFKLIILRIYEILYFPIVIGMIASLEVDKSKILRFTLLTLFVGFLFTGVADSRTKLIAPILLYYMVFSSYTRKELIKIPSYSLNAGFLIFIIFALYVGLLRLNAFDSFSDLLLKDWVTRTDGLELISLVNQAIEIPIYGTHDIKLFSNFIAMIPFHPEANTLKLMGLTSGKSYLLQEILGLSNYDMNNSMVADLYYFYGFLGLLMGGFIYGYFVANFDYAVKNNKIFENRIASAFLISFLINAFRVELDYFTTVAAVARDAIIIYLAYLAIRFEEIKVQTNEIIKKDYKTNLK
jgi:hypothetical protein